MQPWYPRCPPRFGLVAPVRAGLPGGPTADQVRGPGWRQVSHGLYVPSDTEQRPEQRIVEAAARLPATGMVTGWAAAPGAEALRSLGLESFTVVAGDSRTVQVRRMLAARDRAAYTSVPRRWRVGPHVPMRQLSPDLTTEEVGRLAGWGTNPGS